jgi:predicted CopG family antitoxin
MPRDGYESVTLPADLLDDLDDAKRDGESRPDVIRRLLGERDRERQFAVAADAAGVEDLDRRLDRVEDLLDHLPGRVAEELDAEFGHGRP